MKNNEQDSATLQVGESLVVNSAIGTAQVTVNDVPTYVTNATKTFGPYEEPTVLVIYNVSGTTDLTRNRVTPTPSQPYVRKYRATLAEGMRRAITVPAGSRLTLTGNGYAYPGGTFQVSGVTAVEQSPTTRIYIVVAGVGGVQIETGWASVPGGALQFSDGSYLQFSDGAYLELAA